jgi:dUTPase
VAETIWSAIKARTETTAWLTHMHPSCSITAVHVKDLRAANNPTISSTSGAIVGTGTGAPLGQTTALCVTERTAFSGRGFVGRVYLPGLVDSTLANARTFDTVAVTPAAVNFVTGVEAAITPNLGSPVLAQRQLLASTVPGAPPPYNAPRPATTIPITGVNVANPLVDTQRRRAGR